MVISRVFLVLDIALDDNQLRAAKLTVLEYADSQYQKRYAPNAPPCEVHQKNYAAEATVFQGSRLPQQQQQQPLPPSERPPVKVVQAIESLWVSSGLQQVYQRRNEFQLADSAAYFLSNVSKFTSDHYFPSDQDILRTRVTTTGIVKVGIIQSWES